jgi:membrane protease YdiL (CAAX protease family)
MLAGVRKQSGCLKLSASFLVVFSIFQSAAHILGSDRGQAGLLIAAIVIGALMLVERALYHTPPFAALRGLGLGWPCGRGLATALILSALLVLAIPAYAWLRGASTIPYPGWMWLIPGLFAQGGIAEEALFRGYLFRRFHAGRTFWRAAVLATIPFVLAHLYMFAILPWPLALAAVTLSAIIGFPLAHLFELGGSSIWPPALLHFTVQGAIKILEMPGDTLLPILWMAVSATMPWLTFLVGRRREESPG